VARAGRARQESLNTAMHYAASGGHDSIVQLLLEHGGDPNLQNRALATPVHLAAGNSHSRVVCALLDTGRLEVGVCDGNGDSLLLLAARMQATDLVTRLVHAGADHTVANKVRKRLWRVMGMWVACLRHSRRVPPAQNVSCIFLGKGAGRTWTHPSDWELWTRRRFESCAVCGRLCSRPFSERRVRCKVIACGIVRPHKGQSCGTQQRRAVVRWSWLPRKALEIPPKTSGTVGGSIAPPTYVPQYAERGFCTAERDCVFLCGQVR